MSLKLQTIICSTRPGRIGPTVAGWFHEFAGRHGKFDASLVDLCDFKLPLFNEPRHPRLQQYEHEHTRKWSASVEAGDAYVFVTPEYNYCPPPGFGNALNYLSREWNYKACGFVSYGGASGGLRAVQLEKQLVTTLKMMPMMEGVMVPAVSKHIADGNFTSNELIDNSATMMLDELWRWAEGLKAMRGKLPRS
jgi:NAD(P)H-dependent FMN reductase